MKTLNEIKEEVGVWGDKNFTVYLPNIGVLEELGEMAHCIIKRWQRIRGFDDEAYFKKELGDAIADLVIYAIHSAHRQNTPLVLMRNHRIDIRSQDDIEHNLSRFADLVSRLLFCANNQSHIIAYAKAFADSYDLDFETIINDTWEKVSKRDWIKNPKDAHAQV